jgi:DNA-binding NtrC family response regulator
MLGRVLLVDDDEFARGFVRAVLERAGFEVHEFEDVAKAISSASLLDPAVVITDWNLPDGDGGELARRLHQRVADLPVILITGDAHKIEECVSEELLREFTTILHKPFPPSAIEKAIHEAIGQG